MAAGDFKGSIIGKVFSLVFGVFKVFIWIIKKIFGLKTQKNVSEKHENKTEKIKESNSEISGFSDIGNCELKGNRLKVFDLNGKRIYEGNGVSKGELMAFSSKLIILQNEKTISIYSIYDKHLKRLYSGNGIKGTVIQANEFSFITKHGNGTSKYTYKDGNLKTDYSNF